MPGGRRAAGLLGAGLGGFFCPVALLEGAVGDDAEGAVGEALGFPVPAWGKLPNSCAGRNDSSGIDTEAAPGGITSRFDPDLRAVP